MAPKLSERDRWERRALRQVIQEFSADEIMGGRKPRLRDLDPEPSQNPQESQFLVPPRPSRPAVMEAPISPNQQPELIGDGTNRQEDDERASRERTATPDLAGEDAIINDGPGFETVDYGRKLQKIYRDRFIRFDRSSEMKQWSAAHDISEDMMKLARVIAAKAVASPSYWVQLKSLQALMTLVGLASATTLDRLGKELRGAFYHDGIEFCHLLMKVLTSGHLSRAAKRRILRSRVGWADEHGKARESTFGDMFEERMRVAKGYCVFGKLPECWEVLCDN